MAINLFIPSWCMCHFVTCKPQCWGGLHSPHAGGSNNWCCLQGAESMTTAAGFSFPRALALAG